MLEQVKSAEAVLAAAEVKARVRKAEALAVQPSVGAVAAPTGLSNSSGVATGAVGSNSSDLGMERVGLMRLGNNALAAEEEEKAASEVRLAEAEAVAAAWVLAAPCC